MKQRVQIRVIQPKKEGTNNATGQPWVSQEVVVAWPDVKPNGEATENTLIIRLRDEDQQRFEQLHLVVGSWVEMDIQFSTYTSKNGYVNNGVRASIV